MKALSCEAILSLWVGGVVLIREVLYLREAICYEVEHCVGWFSKGSERL